MLVRGLWFELFTDCKVRQPLQAQRSVCAVHYCCLCIDICRGTNYSQDKLLALNPLIRGFGLCKIRAADNNTITGPVGRLYLWRELNTRTAVDASSTQALTFPSSSFNVCSCSTPSQVSTSFLKVIQTF